MNERTKKSIKPSIRLVVAATVLTLLGLSVALPTFLPPQARSAFIKCENNLKQIEIAKREWSETHHATNGAPVNEIEINRVAGWGENRRKCPHGGTYAYGVIGKPPTCSCGRKLLP